jgi:hypothetical protein
MVLSNKKYLRYVLSIFGVLFIAACSNSATAEPASAVIDQSGYIWTITVDRWEISDALNATQSVMQYNGVATNIQYEEKPADGHTFLLMRLTIEKQSAGPSTFQWDQLYVVDGAGHQTQRHPNDTFLANYNLLRIKSTDLVIGRNEGYLCFEIPLSASYDDLILTYESGEGILEIPLIR